MSNLTALNRNSEFSLEQGSVAPLLNAADYEALYQAARALPQWSERTLKTVSECLLQWTADGLARPGNADNLRELVRLLQRLQVHKKPEATPALDVAGTYRVWDSLVTLIVITSPRWTHNRTHPSKRAPTCVHFGAQWNRLASQSVPAKFAQNCASPPRV